ncbi:ATP-dependent sacrificial sulfur transferase LarE [Granulicella cerasi]|uniref:ATP-dependent sacrificial sulfur transferase LarE n=1 Tax=Granulicella cerasi TaxID=741063 RepID=A0ABW1Z5C4_9BACT|nr:ATP-dependent sacrificial sulfur transferase LarE [Granulicella cerasi]
MNAELQSAQQALERELSRYERVAVAYSGGVDSAYLAWATYQVLGDRMVAVIADSASLARADFDEAIAFAEAHTIPLRIVRTDELSQPAYVRNDAQRCFHCKDELFRVMEVLMKELPGNTTLAYGRNVDDAGDFRPGQQAAAMHKVAAPLVDAGLTKSLIRALAQEAGLSVAQKPAAACLASRIEYGREVTAEALLQVESAEAALHALGFRQVRVRHHGEIARIEIAREELAGLQLDLALLDRITASVREAAAFKFVTLDTAGYRTGSMNALLPITSIAPMAHAS